MGILVKMLAPINIILTTMVTSLILFDRHDEEQKKYIKVIWFLLGSTGIVAVYKFTAMGEVIDETLDSEIFEGILQDIT